MKRWLFNVLMKKLFVAVIESQILTVRQNQIFLDGKAMSDDQKKQLISEARAIQNMALWKVIDRRVKEAASEQMYKKSKKYKDMEGGKWTLYTWDIIKRVVQNVSQLRQ